MIVPARSASKWHGSGLDRVQSHETAASALPAIAPAIEAIARRETHARESLAAARKTAVGVDVDAAALDVKVTVKAEPRAGADDRDLHVDVAVRDATRMRA